MPEQLTSRFYRPFNLENERKQRHPLSREPVAHQKKALDKLQAWFKNNHMPYAGGILVFPTGGGKTFAATHFLCDGPLSKGYKVLWLAHTHHLLEQAFFSFETEVWHIPGTRSSLNVRVVSGTEGHFKVAQIAPTDDVLIATLQTMVNAHRRSHPQLEAWLKQAGDKLFVVFDEAHHSPASTYRKLIMELRQHHSEMYVLGLTATPDYMDERKSGWLKELFPQEIIDQASPEELMAVEILAKPIPEQHRTKFSTEFDAKKYQEWVGKNRDIPEEIITKLAESEERNEFIARTYLERKRQQQPYGKTIIFTDRWFQCERLKGLLEKDGVRVDVMFSHTDVNPGSVAARNKRTRDENAQVLERFRRNELDVLINVKMLTEGTDVPDVQTVFLTRQTTSRILLTQMVGRALRGPAFGGTEEAFIVSFIDDWHHLINWAEYTFPKGDKDSPPPPTFEPKQYLIPVDWIAKLKPLIEGDIPPFEFLTFMPIGWYLVKFDEKLFEDKDSEDKEAVQQLVMVFEHQKESYERFIEALKVADITAFAEDSLSLDTQQQRLVGWQDYFFTGIKEHIGGNLLTNLFYITRHMAQNDKQPPIFFVFEERKNHNLDSLAQEFLDARFDRITEDERLQVEYNRLDRYWTIIYLNYSIFQSHYDARIRAILAARKRPPQPPPPPPEVLIPPSEPSDEIKKIIKERDQYRCLCCSEDNRGLLQIDHIKPLYYGGDHSPENLQTLCKICNRTKGIEQISFLIHQATHTPSDFPKLSQPQSNSNSREELKRYLHRSINFFYRCAAVESVSINNGEWYISLYPGNNPDTLQPHLVSLATDIRSAGFQNVRVIRIQSFPSKSHEADKRSGDKSSLPPVKQPRKRRGSKKGLKLLLDGTLCYFDYGGKRYEGKISDGQLIVGQKRYSHFSTASKDITGTEINGWKYWMLKEPGSNNWKLAADWREENTRSIDK